MSTIPPTRPSAAVIPTRARRAHRPRSHLARVLLPLLVLAIMLLPGFAAGAPCVPGSPDCADPPPVLVVPDCDTPPGLITPPSALTPLHALPDAIVPAVAGGQLLPGMGSVSSTGEYQYRIPIEVPAGRAGVQPSIALAYGSRGRNGHVGVGWQLEGFSEINRCARVFATDGYADGVQFDDAADAFCLDGQRLINISGSYGSDQAEYRTENDIFARIISFANPAQGVTAFQVRTKDGRIRTYAPPDAQKTAGVNGAVFVSWPIQEEHDRSGNALFYTYQRSDVGGPDPGLAYRAEYFPKRIDYSLTSGKIQVPGPRSVEFEYEKRPDQPQALIGEVPFTTTKRLKSILLNAPNPVVSQHVWRYDLDYEPGPVSTRSRLIQVQRCSVKADGVTKGACLDAKKFTWNQDSADLSYNAEPHPSDAALAQNPQFVGDFRGDGTTQIISYDGCIYFTVDPAHPLSEHRECADLGNLGLVQRAKIANLYGDGRARIIAPFADDYYVISVGLITLGNTANNVLDFECEVSFAKIPGEQSGNSGASPPWPLHVADLNGDGLPDVIKAESTGNPSLWDWHYRLNVPQSNVPLAWSFGATHTIPMDHRPAIAYDGDSLSFSSDFGKHRAAVFPAEEHDANGGSIPGYHGFGLTKSGNPYTTTTSGLGFQVYADTNGDGIRHVAGYDAPSGKMFLEGNTPWPPSEVVEFPPGIDLSKPQDWRLDAADLDGDGKDEVLFIHMTDERKVLRFSFTESSGYNGTNVIQSNVPFRAPSVIGDFDGDGLLDVLANKDGIATVYHQTGPGRIDRIIAVNNAGDPGDDDKNARETISYSNAQFPDVDAVCRYPQLCPRQGFAVVRERDLYQGAEVAANGSPRRRHFYGYEDPHFDARGRGFLGFGTVREWDADRGAETTTTYDNSTLDDNGIRLVYPGAFRPQTVLSVVPMDVTGQAHLPQARLSKTSYTYVLNRRNQGQTYFVTPLTWDSLEWEEQVVVDYDDMARVHITGIDGVTEKLALRQRTGTYHYDDYGNELDATVKTLDGVRSAMVSTYAYDFVNWLISEVKTTDVTVSEHGQALPAPQHRDYDYDKRGLLCHVYTEKNDSNPEIPQLVTFTHDDEGLVIAVTASVKGKPLRTSHIAYDATERIYPSQTWNDLGQASWTLFDPARGVPLASADANGLQTHFRYDDLGRMVQAIPDGASQTDFSYAPRFMSGVVVGMSRYATSSTGSKSRTDQDMLGRTVQSGHLGFDGNWIEQVTTYDFFGRVSSVTRPGFNAPSSEIAQFSYDNLDRPLAEILPGGGTVEYDHSFLTLVRSDEFTDRETTRDLDGRVVYSVEDARNSRIATSFDYVAFSRLDHVTDPKGNTISFAYDQRGRRTSITDPDAGTTVFHYNGFGEVVSKTASGDLSTYIYDVLGRVAVINHASEWTFNTWDTHGAGRLAHTVSPDGIEQDFKYNALGQLTNLTYTVDGADFDFEMAYDGLGRVVNMAYPAIPGQPNRFSVGRAYNPRGYLGAVYDPSSFTYDPYWRVDGRNADGKLTNVTFGDKTSGSRDYYPDTGLLSGVSEGMSVAFAYGYYADGSLKSREDSLADRKEAFGYDAFHRLTSWELHSSPAIGYHYDDLGNLTEVWSGVTPWNAGSLQEHNVYGTNGKPHTLTSGAQGGYHYDARGRQDIAPGRPSVVYTDRDLPSSITSSSGQTLFQYDAGGARVKKQNVGLSETVITLSGLYERRTKAGHDQHMFFVPGGDDGMVAQVVSEQGDDLSQAKTKYLHHDPLLGSVVAVSDASGALKESFYYEPFGRRTDTHGVPLANGTLDVASGFTGHDHDDDLGLINMRGRIYDPSIRRFLSADPYVPHPLSGQSYNRYSYVLNNPTNLVDPTGFTDEYGWWNGSGGDWGAGGCIGQECAGRSGLGFTSAGFTSNEGGGYSGSFKSGLASGTSGAPFHMSGGGAPTQGAELHRQVSMPTGPSAPGGAITGPPNGGNGAGGAPSSSFETWMASRRLFHFNERAEAWMAEEESTQRESGRGGAPPALMGGDHPWLGSIPVLGLAVSVKSDTSLAPADIGAAAASISGLRLLPSISFGAAVDGFAPMSTVLENGATVRFSGTATAIGDDANVAQNLLRSQGAAGHDLIVHGAIVDGEAQFMVNGMATHPNQIASALFANPSYIRGTSVQLATCYGACGLAQQIEAIIGAPVSSLSVRVDISPVTGLLRALK